MVEVEIALVVLVGTVAKVVLGRGGGGGGADFLTVSPPPPPVFLGGIGGGGFLAGIAGAGFFPTVDVVLEGTGRSGKDGSVAR